ncbi:MAG: serine hydrolase [Sphingomonadales bacterium]|nr:MAG: serine hydrolase [Sphingomonadales bacterium]
MAGGRDISVPRLARRAGRGRLYSRTRTEHRLKQVSLTVTKRLKGRSAMRAPLKIAFIAVATVALQGQASPPARADMDGLFARWATATSPGCAVGVEGRDGVTFKAYGMADLEHGIANTPETVFEAGSVSKQFTAAGILLLAQEGRLKLDDDIRKYLPELPDYGKTITIDHLLTHTSGLRDWGVLSEIQGWPRTDRAMTQPDVLDLVARQRELNYTPGAEYSYTNSGYNLLAIIIARVSGKSFGAFSNERIFAPLGMASTAWRDDFRRIVKGRAIAYGKAPGGYEQVMPFEDAVGNGGLLTTVGDLLTWNRALSSRKLGEFVATEFERRGVLNDGRRIRYARGLRIEDKRGAEVSHAGATGAYRAWLARFTDARLSIALLCNAGDVGPSGADLGYRLADQILPKAPPEKVGPALRDAAAYQGMFVSERSGRPLILVAEGGALQTDAGTKLAPVAGGRLRMGADLVAFQGKDVLRIEDTDGNVSDFRRTAPVSAVGDAQPYLGRYVSDELSATYFVEAKDGGIVLRLDRRPEWIFPLQPSYRDAFLFGRGGAGMVRFERDGQGRASAIRIGLTNRVRGVRFVRADP